ncbi:MAG TPA: SpoIID/LytB domain-containing protein [Acidimicrobiales bacterium]|nr:SpoIID/LytB domain-containing protein [Acidimicrobiales bacterium]
MRTPLRALLAVALLVPLLALVGASPAAAYPSSQIDFEGHGWGHGRGLGQYGSLGYAIDEDWEHSRILDHFYGGTTKGSRANEVISVRLTPFDGKDLVVTSGSSFTVGTNSYAAGEAARIRRTTSGWAIDKAPSLGSGCAATWTELQQVSPGSNPEAKLAQPYTGDDVKLLLQAITCPDMTRRHYRGSLMARVTDGVARTINFVEMESYLRGVVPRESPASWGDADGGRGMNALKAQTVAARSYAYAETRNALYKTCDTTACQVYGGAGLNNARTEHANTDRAIQQTAGEVRVDARGNTARTEFSSSTGGHTAGGTFTAVPDSGDDVSSNPNHEWTHRINVTAVEAAFPAVGRLQTITVSKRNGLGDQGGRATEVKLVGDGGSVTVTGNDVRSKLGLKSDWFRIIDPSLNAPAVGVASMRAESGLVVASTAGEALGYGAASAPGSMEGIALRAPMVAIAMTPSGEGYWMAASDGGVFAFGDARKDLGSLGGQRLNKPIVGMAATPSGNGYYLVASDGGIFTFGDARFLGSMGAVRLNQPIVGMAVHPTGAGYYMVARDGGIFTFGSAKFRGSTGNIVLNQPIVGMAVHPRGLGYWFVAADGGVFAFPSPRLFYGSQGATALPAPVVAMASSATGNGYWLLGRDGALYDFGDAGF